MPNSQTIIKQIDSLTRKLVKIGLSVDQNTPFNKNGEIIYSGMQNISIAMKNISYKEIYYELEKSKNYNIKMIDGALIQMLYTYQGTELKKHRLSFFPNPNLESYQNEPEIYEDDEIYADILAKNIVTFPIRFDYDPKHFEEINHPKSHVTFGQYKNCRVPVSEPLTPEIFITFILRNFYNTAFRQFTDEFNLSSNRFPQTITDDEKKLLHFGVY